MADVWPLRGIRFDSQRTGPIGPLLAPPYDVATEPVVGAKFSIRNIESVELGAPGDQHSLAAQRYQTWLDQGVLRQDAAPAIYVHRHRFSQRGTSATRTGLLARVRLQDWEERIVLPHERTTPRPREERLNRLRAVGANLSPLYLLYRDADSEIRTLIAEYAGNGHLLDNRDRVGGIHHLEAIADPQFHDRLATAFARRALFVADGHHRYEAALAYRDECREGHGFDPDAPWEFVLALLSSVEDSGVIVRPTHRILSDERHRSPHLLMEVFQRWFDLNATRLDETFSDDRSICRIVLPGEHGVWDVRARPEEPHRALMPRHRGRAWRSLAVATVESVVESLLGAGVHGAEPHLLPAIDEVDAVNQVEHGTAQAAFLLPAPSLHQLLTVAEEGDLLPAKSTWFEPKAPAGLVISDLRT